MAVTPVSVPAFNRRISPPAQPEAPRQQLVVPGRPQAQHNRPEQAQGRIPVAGGEPEPLKLIEDIDRQVKTSKEYQALRPFLEKIGLAEKDETQTDAPNPEAKESPVAEDRRASPPPQSELQLDSASSFSFRMTITRVSVESESRIREEPVRRSDPLALDLDGDGLETSGLQNGIAFDIDADGHMDLTSFITGDDAFVALDRNGNGRIDDGSELFGDQNGDDNGYEALARYDDNGDNRIDRNDAVYQHLRLFSIAGDGSRQQQSLSEAGIESLSLAWRQTEVALNAYDTIAQQATFTRSDGSLGESGDLILGFRRSDHTLL